MSAGTESRRLAAALTGLPAKRRNALLLVVSYENSPSGWVTPIRTASNTALRPIKVAGFPGAVLITRRTAPHLGSAPGAAAE